MKSWNSQKIILESADELKLVEGIPINSFLLSAKNLQHPLVKNLNAESTEKKDAEFRGKK